MIDVGIKGALWSLQAATPHLIARGGGCVINLSSVAVSFAIRNAAVAHIMTRLVPAAKSTAAPALLDASTVVRVRVSAPE